MSRSSSNNTAPHAGAFSFLEPPPMYFGSVCSGIEAASVAWHPLGWRAAWLAEIEPFPSAVLAHHYPDVPNLGDMTTISRRVLTGEVSAPDVFCGGTPCQAFSVAGLRQSLDDARGNLTLKFVEIADAIDHVRTGRGEDECIVFWENVPGVLSTKDNAFGCFLGGLAVEDGPLEPPGGKWANAGCVFGPKRAVAWRVLDAQYFGVAQRRRRVFVVASARKGFDPATVLFEWDGVRRDSAPRREARQTAPTIPARSTAGGGLGTDFDCDGGVITMTNGQRGAEIGFDRGPTLTCNHEAPIAACGIRTANTSSNGWGVQEEYTHTLDCAQGVAVAQPVAFHPTQDPISSTDGSTHALGCGSIGGQASVAVAVALRGREGGATAELGDEVQNCLRASSGGGDKPHVLTAMHVRRLTPTECERLQGFPDSYTNIPWRTFQEASRKGISYETLLAQRGMTLRGPSIEECPDGPRYKALGNSWAVPNVRWIGQRIDAAVRGLQ